MESILKEIQQMKERMGSLTTAEDISAMARQINILIERYNNNCEILETMSGEILTRLEIIQITQLNNSR